MGCYVSRGQSSVRAVRLRGYAFRERSSVEEEVETAIGTGGWIRGGHSCVGWLTGSCTTHLGQHVATSLSADSGQRRCGGRVRELCVDGTGVVVPWLAEHFRTPVGLGWRQGPLAAFSLLTRGVLKGLRCAGACVDEASGLLSTRRRLGASFRGDGDVRTAGGRVEGRLEAS